jgi:tRNA(Ile)-lysidine synthase
MDAFLLHFAEHAFFQDEPTRIGVAVSGGSDSMAALHLMVQAGVLRGWTVQAVTVDHGLRAEAADEARFVAAACARIGVAHTVLQWRREGVTGNLQDQARLGRYGVMTAWAREQGITHMVLGHTADDQAETFLMGLAREAGIDGLVGMRSGWKAEGVKWVRPFLVQERGDLRDYLERQAIKWVEDPSNADDRFTRVRARRVLEALKPLGITVARLTGVMANLCEAQGAVGTAVRRAEHELATIAAGAVTFDRKLFRREGGEVQRRLVIGALRWIAGAKYAPRANAMFRLLMNIQVGKDSTLAGCRIRVEDTEIRILREPKAVTGVACPTDQPWDNRWHLTGPHAPDLTIRALGDGIRSLPNWRATGLPRDTLVVSPAIWRGDALIAAPLAGFPQGWTAKIAQSFDAFILSH